MRKKKIIFKCKTCGELHEGSLSEMLACENKEQATDKANKGNPKCGFCGAKDCDYC